MPPSDWPLIERGAATDYTIFSVRRDRRRSPRTGAVRRFSIVECVDWVNVIALTPSDEVVLVDQFRHGVEAVTCEIPGGMIDPGETPLQAGQRELLEETGYAAETWRDLGVVTPNPAFQTNRCHTVLALDARRVAGQSQDPGEDITVGLAPLASIPARVAEGRIDHALVIAAFFHLLGVSGGWRRPPAA